MLNTFMFIFVFQINFYVILMDNKIAFLSKTRTFLRDPKLFNGSVYVGRGKVTMHR